MKKILFMPDKVWYIEKVYGVIERRKVKVSYGEKGTEVFIC